MKGICRNVWVVGSQIERSVAVRIGWCFVWMVAGWIGCSLAAMDACGQSMPVHAIGGSFNQFSDSIAVVKSIDHYHRAALKIAKNPPKGMVAFEIEKPETTIYPNRDGTFDAVSNGLVRFMPIDVEEFRLPMAARVLRSVIVYSVGANPEPVEIPTGKK